MAHALHGNVLQHLHLLIGKRTGRSHNDRLARVGRTRGYLTANFYMEIGKKNYEVELIVDEDWQCSDCSVYNVEEDKEDVKLKIIILNEYSGLYATLKREAYEKLDREAKLYEEHEQSLMYDFLL